MVTIRATLGVLLAVMGAVLLGIGPSLALAQSGEQPLGGVIITIETAQDKGFVAKSITGNDGLVRFYVPTGIYRIIATNTTVALRAAATKRAGAAADTDRTTSITMVVTTTGSVREQRMVVAQLAEGKETSLLIETTVASPIRVVVRRSEE